MVAALVLGTSGVIRGSSSLPPSTKKPSEIFKSPPSTQLQKAPLRELFALFDFHSSKPNFVLVAIYLGLELLQDSNPKP